MWRYQVRRPSSVRHVEVVDSQCRTIKFVELNLVTHVVVRGGRSPRRVRGRWSAALGVAAVGAALLLTGCSGGSGASSTNGEKPVVLTTFTVLEDIAENVAGDHPVVESMTEPGAEVHGHEPTPGGIRKASEAGPILDYGLNLEAWFGGSSRLVVKESVASLA